jgi:hypothetical protein
MTTEFLLLGENNMDDRKTFLMEMYREMFADINRQMTVVWQTVSVVVGAFALLALVEKNIVPLDIAVSLIIILSAWMYAHMLDGAYWYNRNLVIIANIERQFLLPSDQRHIQFYFGKHRSSKNRMISYFKIQAGLAVAISGLVLAFHFSTRVFPGLNSPSDQFEFPRTLPYLAALASAGICLFFARDRRKSYEGFIKNSPGIDIDTTGITYGPGHTVDP